MRQRGITSSVIAVVVMTLVIGACGSSSKKVEAPPSTTTPVATRDVLDTAAYDAELATFSTTAGAAGLNTKLTGKGPFTIFAPGSAAFAALGSGRLATLLRPAAKQQLASMLAYHVVRGRLLAKDLKDGPLKTLDGAMITVSHDGDKVVLTGANGSHATIVRPDIKASNGVMHVIDGVLQPPK
ncbi:MAG TPA: fasciclin domain-containing protein [Acidimicrobiia bacterium]|nr:fasciclin domain-containing protein [Acidimicrobiia bacterium]